MMIENSAARRQAKIDSGAEVIVGVNKYRLEHQEHNFEIRHIDNRMVREKQVASLNKTKAERDNKKVKEILNKMTEVAKSGNGNLMELSVEAAKARATLGEISEALEKVFGRHQPKENIVRGAYSAESSAHGDYGKKAFEKALDRVKKFA